MILVETGIHVRDVLFGHLAEVLFFCYREKNEELERTKHEEVGRKLCEDR